MKTEPPTLAEAIHYAMSLRGAEDCYADRCTVVLVDALMELSETNRVEVAALRAEKETK